MTENLCIINNCHACCEGPTLKLNLAEAATLRNLGTTLLGLNSFNNRRNIPRGKEGTAYYNLSGPCGALSVEGLCTIYMSSDRPNACSTLIPGSKDCLDIRRIKGLGELKTQ